MARELTEAMGLRPPGPTWNPGFDSRRGYDLSMGKILGWIGDHKKFAAKLLGLLIMMIPDKYVDMAHKEWMVGLVATYILGQGIADNGKEAAKLRAAPVSNS